MIMILLPSKICIFLKIQLRVHAVHADRIWQCSEQTSKRKLLVAHRVLLEPAIFFSFCGQPSISNIKFKKKSNRLYFKCKAFYIDQEGLQTALPFDWLIFATMITFISDI